MTTENTTTSLANETDGESDNRLQMIQETAYYLAEDDGFAGDPAEYWYKAEVQVDYIL
jgi:hypothetical protein